MLALVQFVHAGAALSLPLTILWLRRWFLGPVVVWLMLRSLGEVLGATEVY